MNKKKIEKVERGRQKIEVKHYFKKLPFKIKKKCWKKFWVLQKFFLCWFNYTFTTNPQKRGYKGRDIKDINYKNACILKYNKLNWDRKKRTTIDRKQTQL